MEDIDLFY